MQDFARALLAFTLLAVTACQSPQPEIRSSLTSTAQLTTRAPVDIALLPVQDATDTKALATLMPRMRDEAARGLVARAYSPLAFPLIDRALPVEATTGGLRAVDPAYQKTLSNRWNEDAILGIRVTRFETSALQSTGWVQFAADVLLTDSKNGDTLWAGPVEGRVKSGGLGPAPLDPTERLRDASAQVVKEILLLMPSRPMVPATAR
jgi:hypothetical protein